MLHMDPMLQNSGTTGLRKAAKLNLGFAIPSDWRLAAAEGAADPSAAPLPVLKDEREQDPAFGLPGAGEKGASEKRESHFQTKCALEETDAVFFFFFFL